MSLPDQVSGWGAETRALIHACIRLAEYFGTDEEESSFRAAMAAPLSLVATIEDPTRWSESPISSSRPPDLACGEALAAIASPLLQVICEPVPEFVATARSMGTEDARRLITLFGIFSGTFGRHVCAPVWRAYPKLAPEGWPL